MKEKTWGIKLARTGEIHRDNMTEQQAREWIKEWEEDGGRPGAFVLVSRTLSPWTEEK